MLKVRMSGSMDSFLQKVAEHIMYCMKEALAKLCEECDEKARSNDGGWQNRTGNLRSSIGAAVYDNGKVYFMTAFEQVLGGSIGSAKGRALIQSLASSYADAIAMVIIAAMEYAETVEAIDSKDVLESTRLYAESVVMERLEEAKEKAIKDINSWKL